MGEETTGKKRYVERIVKLGKKNLASAHGENVEYLGNTGIYENAVVNHNQPRGHKIRGWDQLITDVKRSIEANLNRLLGSGGWKLCEPTEFVEGRPVTHFAFADERMEKLNPLERATVHDLMEATDLCLHADRAILAGNTMSAAAFAYTLGRAIERCAVRQKEPQAAKGNRRDDQSRANVEKQKAEADERHHRLGAAVEEQIERQKAGGGKVNYTAACQAVADIEDCSLRTVTNAVRNQWTTRRPAK